MPIVLLLSLVCFEPSNSAFCVDRGVVEQIGDELLSRAGPDDDELEQAAFLTSDASGGVGCLLWPRTAKRSMASYRGAWPDGTIGIVHTHPHERFMPSDTDKNVSRRFRLPVIVITHSRIEFVSSDWAIRGWSYTRASRLADEDLCRPIESLTVSPTTAR